MIEAIIVAVALGVGMGLVVVLSDWRASLALAALCVGLSRLLEWRELQTFGAGAASAVPVLMGIAVVAAACMVLIVLLTGLTYNRTYDLTPTDEVEAMELRRVLRQAARIQRAQGWPAWRLPAFAGLLFVVGTVLVPLFYPVPVQPADYAWTMLVMGGVLAAAISDTLLKLGTGVLLVCVGLKLCYVRLAQQIGMFDLVLFDIVPIVLALLLALLSNVLFTRLGTLRLATLFDQARSSPLQPSSAAHATSRPSKSDTP